MPLVEHLAPSIGTDNIVVHFDDTTQSIADAKAIINAAGVMYPLLKVRNTLIHYSNIKSFKYTVGDALLPTITCTFLDPNFSTIDYDYPITGDTCVIYIGNNNDSVNKPIKQQFEITDARAHKNVVTIEAILFIPGILQSNMQAFDSSTSLQLLIAICKVLGLGVVTNLTQLQDIAVRTQHGMSYLDYIAVLAMSCWKNANSFTHIFIDQYYRLNILELTELFDAGSINQSISTNVLSGEPLDESHSLLLSNNITKHDTQFIIQQWQPITESGAKKYSKPHSIQNIIALKDYEQQTVNHDISNSQINTTNNELQDTIVLHNAKMLYNFAGAYTVNSSYNYLQHNIAYQHNMLGALVFLYNALQLKCTLNIATNYFTLGQVVPVDIYDNVNARHVVPISDDQQDNDASQEYKDASIDTEQISLNDLYSGDYVIMQICWLFSRKHKLQQHMQLSKRYHTKHKYDNI
jgi:hypothetical protein